MISGANIGVHAEFRGNHPPARLQFLLPHDAFAAVAGQHAFPFGEDHLQALHAGGERLLEDLGDLADVIRAHPLQPFDPHAAQGVLDRQIGELAVLFVRGGGQVLLAGGRGEPVVHHHQHRVVAVELGADHSGSEAVVPEASVAHEGDHPLVDVGGDPHGTGQAQPVSHHGVAQIERGERGEGVTADVRADVHLAHLLLRQLQRAEHRALGTAHAKPGGAFGEGLPQQFRGPPLVFRHPRGFGRGHGHGGMIGHGGAHIAAQPGQQHFAGVFSGHGQKVLAVHGRIDAGFSEQDVHRLLDVIGVALLDHQYASLVLAKPGDFLGHQGMHHVEHQQGHRGLAEAVGQSQLVQCPDGGIVHPALEDDAHVFLLALEHLVQFAPPDEIQRRGKPHMHLLLFLQIGGGGQANAVEILPRLRQGGIAGNRGLFVVLADKAAMNVTGADAELHHHRGVGLLGQLEGLFDEGDELGEMGPGIEQPDGRFQREGVGAFLDDAGALAIILADDDQGAARHAGRSQVGQGVGSHVGAHHRLPHHGAPHGIIDRRAQHGRRGGLVGAGLDVNAQLVQDFPAVVEHVHHVRDGRALIPPHVAHPGLQQGLGHGQDAFSVKDLPFPQFQRFHFLGERSLHTCSFGRLCFKCGSCLV